MTGNSDESYPAPMLPTRNTLFGATQTAIDGKREQYAGFLGSSSNPQRSSRGSQREDGGWARSNYAGKGVPRRNPGTRSPWQRSKVALEVSRAPRDLLYPGRIGAARGREKGVRPPERPLKSERVAYVYEIKLVSEKYYIHDTTALDLHCTQHEQK